MVRIVSRIDIECDKFQLDTFETSDISVNAEDSRQFTLTPYIHDVRAAVRALSAGPHRVLPRRKLLTILKEAQNLHHRVAADSVGTHDENLQDALWLLAEKAAIRTLGIVLTSLLDQAWILEAEIGYWDGVLASPLATGYYIIQTFPARISHQLQVFYSRLRTHLVDESWPHLRSIGDRWKRFYQIVHRTVEERNLGDVRTTLLSPLSRRRSAIREQRKLLSHVRDLNACGTGLLVEECFAFGGHHEKMTMSRLEWRNVIFKSVLLIDVTLRSLTNTESSTSDFADDVFGAADNESRALQSHSEDHASAGYIEVIDRLIQILQQRSRDYEAHIRATVHRHGRPSLITRYWLPTTAALLSASTVLKFVTSRRAELVTWLCELGMTVVDFWRNWVLQPIEQLIGTIRHDEQSQIAIMSRRSLVADRDSLERMVVDFVRDHPEPGTPNAEQDVSAIAASVREGDVTPVLRAYERDLRQPFMGAVRGDLIRALLIQIQKTKVDVEVAISGIDSLLKSQQLVFGFVVSIVEHCYETKEFQVRWSHSGNPRVICRIPMGLSSSGQPERLSDWTRARETAPCTLVTSSPSPSTFCRPKPPAHRISSLGILTAFWLDALPDLAPFFHTRIMGSSSARRT